MFALAGNKRVYIRGAGLVCAMGASQQTLAQACHGGQTAVSHIAAAQISDCRLPYYKIGESIHPAQNNRLYALLDYIAEHAIDDANLRQPELTDTAVFCGSTACDISDLEEHYRNELIVNPDATPLYRSGFGVLAGYVRDRFHLGGEEYSFNTACSSSANALIMAAQMIAAGRCEHAVVLGVEVFNQLTFQGFGAMMLLSSDACRPFDANRSGTVLGEAVAAVVLSGVPPRDSQFAGDKPFYFLGGANLCDTKSVTSSHPDVIAAVMRSALRHADVRPGEVDVIKAHGTGTENNDSAEGHAMRQVFAAKLPPFTSLKPYVGHTLGACGVAELSLLLATTKQGFIPNTPAFVSPDPQLKLQPMREHLEFQTGTIMLNYFGFGGNNSSLLLCNR